jgi:alkanesulfonate monooxygenase SsuD/methylene tetrahydromethanopterin reductase-like flavin-dependent oxidoreductase (luciferase family)
MKQLMTTDGATFDGRYYRIENASYHPRPVQQPHPPIWIGGSGERVTIPMAGRHADAWHAQGPVSSYPRKQRILDEAADRAGRDPRDILRAATLSLSQPWDGVRADADVLREMGFTYLVVSWPSEGRGHLETFVERVMPELTAR